MVKEGYSSLPPEVHQYTDPALETTVKYCSIGYDNAKHYYNQAADVILERDSINEMSEEEKYVQHQHEHHQEL